MYFMVYSRVSRVWIGLSSLHNKAVFRWTSGSPLQYDNWTPGAQLTQSKCVILAKSGRYQNEDCLRTYSYICQRDTGIQVSF